MAESKSSEIFLCSLHKKTKIRTVVGGRNRFQEKFDALNRSNHAISRDVRPLGLALASRPFEAKILWPRPRGSWPRPRGFWPRPRGSGHVEAGAEATVLIIMLLSY